MATVRPEWPVTELSRETRERAIPILRESFEGIYRWHAKRTLLRVPIARMVEVEGAVAGVSLLEWLDPTVAYVYYLFVGRAFRNRGIGGRLLDDALDRFRNGGAEVVFAAHEDENVASRRLFLARGFREVDRSEPPVQEGGLGARGYRSRMMVVAGESLLGLRLARAGGADSLTGPTPGSTGRGQDP